MNDENLYPELVDYIFNYETRFMDDNERIAAGVIIFTSEDPRERMIEGGKFKRGLRENEIRKQMLVDGFDVFKKRVVNRIYSQHKNELNLNLCPKCGKIARTPLAKQCRFCFYSWHSYCSV